MKISGFWAATIAFMMVTSGLAFLTVGMTPVTEDIVSSDGGGAEPTDVPTTGLIREVLYEDHTNSKCSPCVAVEATSVPIMKTYVASNLVAPMYPHMWWPGGDDAVWLYSSSDAGPRNPYYGSFTGVPHVRMDGVKIRHHSSSPEVYWSYYNWALGQLSRFSITTSGDLGTETVSAVVEAHEVIEPNPNRRIKFGLWEDNIDVYGRFGNRSQYFTEYHWAMWDMLPDSVGEAVFPAGANPGDKQWFNRTFFIDPTAGIGGMVPSELGVTVFIQNDDDLSVEQAAVEKFVPDPPLPTHELATYGLEVDGDPLHTFEGPNDFTKAGKSVQVKGTVCNYGDSIESDIQVDLVFEGAVQQTKFITSIEPGHGEQVIFDWVTPTSAGVYDIGVQCELIGGEANVTNNIHEKPIEIRVTSDLTMNPGSFNFIVNGGAVGHDNLTLANTNGLANLNYNTAVGATADVFGNQVYGSLWITSYDCGNIYSVTTTTTLTEIKMYLGMSVSRQIYFLVYEGDTEGGTYTKIHETNISNPTPGEKWFSTGPINVNLQAGKYYYIALQYQFSVTWFFEDPFKTQVPQPASFGSMLSGSYGNSIGLPPAASLSNPRMPRGALRQALVTVDGSGSWLSANPGSGSIAPPGQSDSMLTADATSLTPGLYQTNLLVSTNDPDNYFVNVPVDLNVATGVSFDIPIAAGPSGWEFISFPLNGVSGDVNTILDDTINGDSGTTWDQVQWYDAQTQEWKSYAAFKPASLNNMPVMDNTMGVWVHITSNGGDNVITTGQTGIYPALPVDIDLYTGWNLVGYPSAMARFPFLTVPPQADMVAFYDDAQPYDIIDQPVVTVQQFQEGNAYWVRVTADCTWQVNP